MATRRAGVHGLQWGASFRGARMMRWFSLFAPPDVERLKDRGDVKRLLEALQHTDAKRRRAAAAALGVVADSRAVRPLIAALRDEESFEVRAAVAGALGDLGDPMAVGPLTATVVDGGGRPARLRGFEPRQILDMAYQWKEFSEGSYPVRKAAVEALVKLRALSALAGLLNHRDTLNVEVRAWAAAALGRLGDRSATEPLVSSLSYEIKDRDYWVDAKYEAAAHALAALDGIDAIVRALRPRENPTLRRGAAKALSILGESRTLPALVDALRDRDAHTRYWSAVALGKLADRRAVKPLIACLKDASVVFPPSDEAFTHSTVADAAARALEQIGGPGAERALARRNGAKKPRAQAPAL